MTVGRYRSKRYDTYIWQDETSAFDPAGKWCGGDSYWRTFSARIPRKMLARARTRNQFKEVFDWLERNEHKPGVWLDVEAGYSRSPLERQPARSVPARLHEKTDCNR